MARTELGEHLRHLFRRGDAYIGDQAAMQRFRVIEVEHIFSEIGAVVRGKMKTGTVRRRTQLANQRIVLLRSGFNLEAVDGAIVG